MANTIYLLLGTNLGDRGANLREASALLAGKIGPVTARSSVYQTAPWGLPDQPDFWNQVIRLSTTLPPDRLIEEALAVESALGRERKERWGARLIDVDILYYEDWIVAQDNLQIPHPQLQNRRFTLVPLAELAPDLVHPVLHQTNQTLLDNCPDTLPVTRLSY